MSDELDLTFIKKRSIDILIEYISIKIIIKILRRLKF